MDSGSKNLDEQHIIRDILPIFLSDESITPNNLPRNTQPSFGKYLTRKDGKCDLPDTIQIDKRILDRWVARSRGSWVDKPGRNNFLHEVCDNFSSRMTDYNPRNNFDKMLFPRPVSCELKYINDRRLRRVRLIEEKYDEPCEIKLSKMNVDTPEDTCKFLAPFWWKREGTIGPDNYNKYVPELNIVDGNKQISSQRWRPVPDFVAHRNRTKCQRKKELRQVGQPFKHEACVFYNEHYPAPNLKRTLEKFSK